MIKEDLSMDVGNALTFNDSDYKQAYTVYHIPQKHGGYIHNNNVLTINSTNKREMGVLLGFNQDSSVISNVTNASDTARISMYKDLSDISQSVYPDRSTLEIAISDNGWSGSLPGDVDDRIIVRKYTSNRTFDKPDGEQPYGTKKYWDHYNLISEEMALIDYDGKTKIGANKLVVGDIDVYQLLTDLAAHNGLDINDYRTTGFISDYRNKDNYREIEKTIDGTA